MFSYQKIRTLVDDFQSKDKSLRIQDIANSIGIAKGSFENYRDGVNKPTVEVLERIALYFGRDMNYFFDTMTPVAIEKPQPVIIEGNDYILKRFEELVAENALLKKKVEEYERSNDTSYTLQNVPVSKAAEPTPELRKK